MSEQSEEEHADTETTSVGIEYICSCMQPIYVLLRKTPETSSDLESSGEPKTQHDRDSLIQESIHRLDMRSSLCLRYQAKMFGSSPIIGNFPSNPQTALYQQTKHRSFRRLQSINRLDVLHDTIKDRTKLEGRQHGRSASTIYGLTFEPLKIYNLGERGSGTTTVGPQQDFYSLHRLHLERKTLFEDPEFPANNSSLYLGAEPRETYVWRRPGELVARPEFFVEGVSRFDNVQGKLGDCWLSAALDCLTLYKSLFFQVVPENQSFGKDYSGIFHFCFWYFGRWVDVVVDDRLPVRNGRLVYLHSNDPSEFWSALLEKAYAKLYGCYESLRGGSTSEAMEDFTGGLVEVYKVPDFPGDLFKLMIKAYERASLIGCSMEPDPNVGQMRTPEGLVRGHAYSVTKLNEVLFVSDGAARTVSLLRLKNPWGGSTEWTGAWSDRSREWRFLSQEKKAELGLTFANDGEFWMCFDDFRTHFSYVELCNLNPDSLFDDERGKGRRWEVSVYEGEWVEGVTAGGCRNNPKTFHCNPQYRITLNRTDDDDAGDKCTIIVSLMQKHKTRRRLSSMLTIGFVIYRLRYPERLPEPLDYFFFKYNNYVAKSPKYVNMRGINGRYRLPPDTYCIVPSTYFPNEEGQFLLRVFSEQPNDMSEHDQQVRFKRMETKLSAAKAGDDARIREVMNEIEDPEGELGWSELKAILERTEGKKCVFSKEICRSMIAMMDASRSGRLNREEFMKLWSNYRLWKDAFSKFDVNKSRTICGFELRKVMEAIGFRLNARMLNLLMHRFGNRMKEIEFDDFISCTIKLTTMINLFLQKNNVRGYSSFEIEDWLECTLYS